MRLLLSLVIIMHGLIHLLGYGEAVWHTPEGEFSYGKFNLVEIEYNLKEFK
jgi:hypothetical protein